MDHNDHCSDNDSAALLGLAPERRPLSEYSLALGLVRHAIVPWTAKIIVVDGRSGVGKTSLAQFLSWKTQIPVIFLDMFLLGDGKLKFRTECLAQTITSRLRIGPVIIEGIAALQALADTGHKWDQLIYVSTDDYDNSTIRRKLAAYEKHFRPSESAHLNIKLQHTWL